MICLFTWVSGRLHVMQTIVISKRTPIYKPYQLFDFTRVCAKNTLRC